MAGPAFLSNDPESSRLPRGLQSPAGARKRSAGENFPVAMRVLPRQVGDDILSLYGYARMVDDLGDQAQGDRLALLDAFENELDAALAGRKSHPVLARIVAVSRRRGFSDQPLRRLIEANRLDQIKSRYASFDELMDYCRLSANPVGEVVLGIFGCSDAQRVAWSDSVCSALQVLEHLQDVAEDAERGRVYLPEADMAVFGVSEAVLVGRSAPPELRRLVAYEAHRAGDLLVEGTPLVKSLRGWARVAVAGFLAGGQATLDALSKVRFDVLAAAARPTRAQTLRHFALLSLGSLREGAVS